MTEKNVSANRTHPYAWVILVLVFFASVAGPLNMSKVPPLMDPLMAHYAVGMTAAGWLMSIFAVVGVMLAMPSGFLLGFIGGKKVGVLALGFLVAGSVMGAVFDSFAVLMFSRVLEGIGMCFMPILAPAAISAWFSPEKRGLPMGIWAVWVPVGSIAAFVVAPRVAGIFGWQLVWWLGAAYAALLLILFILFFRMPASAAPVNLAADTRNEPRRMTLTMKRRDPWLLAVSFGAYNVISLALSTFMPTYLERERGFSPETASLLVSGMMAVCIVSIILGGLISDKLNTRKKCIAVPFLLCAALLGILYLPGYGIICTLWAIGFWGGIAVTPVFTAATEIVPLAETPGSLGILALGQNMGMCLGPIYFAFIVESMGWVIAAYALIPFIILAAVAAWCMKIR